jgi:predicted nucleic acid-binding protein
MQSTALVADASIVVSLFESSERRDIADRLFESNDFSAPDLLFAETASALWSPRRSTAGPREPAMEFLTRIRGLIRVVESESLAGDAFEIACNLDHPVYDAFYLALARRIRSHVVTFDQRLIRKIAGTRYESLARLAR